jgi:hypothetical protein
LRGKRQFSLYLNSNLYSKFSTKKRIILKYDAFFSNAINLYIFMHLNFPIGGVKSYFIAAAALCLEKPHPTLSVRKIKLCIMRPCSL